MTATATKDLSGNKLLEYALDVAAQIVLDGDQAAPVFIGEAEDGKMAVFMAPWRSESEKMLALSMIKIQFAKLGVNRYAHVSEAWLASVDPKANPEHLTLKPSQRADRKEGLSGLLVERDKKTVTMMRMIERTPEGIQVLPASSPDYTSVAGLMTEMLFPIDVRKLEPEQRKRLNKALDATLERLLEAGAGKAGPSGDERRRQSGS